MSSNKAAPLVHSLKRKLQEIFQCTVCYKTPRTTVLQCQNGHITCDKCAENSSSCPMCREPLDSNKRIRCLAVEQVIEAVDLEVACKNEGCEFSSSKKDIEAHEKGCDYRLVPCPFHNARKCEKMSVSKIIVHYFETISSEVEEFVDNSHTVNFSSPYFREENRKLSWHKCANRWSEHFILVAKKTQGIVYIYAQVIGDAKMADDYKALIAVGSFLGKTKIFHHAKIFPIDEVVDVEEEESVLKFSVDGIGEMLLEQVAEKMRLSINFTIKEVARLDQANQEDSVRNRSSPSTPRHS